MLPTIIIPDFKRRHAELLDQQQLLRQWHQEHVDHRDRDVPPKANICFAHSNQWRDSWLSIQNCHDTVHGTAEHPHLIWWIGGGLMLLGDGMWLRLFV